MESLTIRIELLIHPLSQDPDQSDQYLPQHQGLDEMDRRMSVSPDLDPRLDGAAESMELPDLT